MKEIKEEMNTYGKSKIWDRLEEMSIGDVRIDFQDNNSSERLTKTPFGYVYSYGDMQGLSSVLINNK